MSFNPPSPIVKFPSFPPLSSEQRGPLFAYTSPFQSVQTKRCEYGERATLNSTRDQFFDSVHSSPELPQRKLLDITVLQQR